MYNDSISTNNLCIGYENRIVQRNLTFSLCKGEMVCMLGPNGGGKSTLLRTLAGLQPALSGESSLAKLSPAELAKNLSLVLTERVSIEQTTVHDVVAMGRYPYTSFLGGLSEEDERIVDRSMQEVDIVGYRDTMFNALSDGEKQRVLIAKALAQETPVILLDEPTAHLDLPNRIHILRLLRNLAHEQQKTILISTHELELALALADRIMLVSPAGVRLDSPNRLRETDAFAEAFGMDIFHPVF